MRIKKPAILFTLDSMKHPNTGLYYFGKSLGLAISELQRHDRNLDISFYLPKKGSNIFDGIKHSELHKFYFPEAKKFDLVHFTDQICRLKPHRVSGKKVLTIHDLNFIHEKSSSESNKENIKKLNRYIHQCEKIVAISKFVANDIITYFPQVENKIQVIYNGADRLNINPAHIPAYLPYKPFIFTIGEVLMKKNFHVLPPLLANNDYELVIAGNLNATAYERTIEKVAKQFNCENRVKIIGPVTDEDKAWYYENCVAFAFPSIAEGFGLPIIEAMHFGKPVFLSTKTAVPEIGGDSAFYFTDFDPENMQKTFSEGMNIYDTHSNLKQSLMDRAELFSWDKTAREYYDLYRSLLF